MVKRKNIRERGKIQLSKYFQEFEDGESVAIVNERSVASSFPKRMQGRTGIIQGRRGKSYLVKISDQNKEKVFIVEPIHLKKIKTIVTK